MKPQSPLSGPVPLVILAGGLGTRIRPLTETLPKSMIPILGKPFIAYQLDWIARSGVTEVILAIGYLGEQIQEFVQNGEKWNLQVKYHQEGQKGGELMGTAGALRSILDAGLLPERFLTTYGDSFLPVHYGQIWEKFQKTSEPALMTVLRNSNCWDTSNAIYSNDKVILYDKSRPTRAMEFIDYGVSGLCREIIESRVRPQCKTDLAAIYHELSREGLLGGMEVHHRFYEVGSIQGIRDFENYLMNLPSQYTPTSDPTRNHPICNEEPK